MLDAAADDDRRRRSAGAPGPGSGPGGAPPAIALSPILSARYRSRDLERIRAAAPGARIVTLSVEGLADGPLDDVEVMLRGWLQPGRVRPAARPRAAPGLGPLGDVRRGAGADARRPASAASS